jgi:cytochrome bd ubiquinol oxidase subunit I
VPIGDIDIPGIGKEVVMATIWQSHILWSAAIIGLIFIGATAEYVGVLTKQIKYDRFAEGTALATILLFATGSFTPIFGILFLITLYPVFWSYMQNIMFWVLFAEAFMFVGEIILLYAWYASWEKLAYRKKLHVVIGFMAAMFLTAQMTFINVVASYLLTPSDSAANNVGATFMNATFIPLNMHRFVGNISYAGFLIAGYAALRYLRSTTESNREYYDWMGHWGLLWGFGFFLLQPFIGYGYLKSIREHNAPAFDYIMQGDKSWLFNMLAMMLGIISVTSVSYCLHKLKYAVKPLPTLRNITLGALGFLAVFSLLNIIPANGNLVPQIGLVLFDGKGTEFPLGQMYPWKFFGIIGMILVGVFALGLYLKATAEGFYWGRAGRWSQYALLTTAVAVIITMLVMGYTRETARRGANPPDESGGFLINSCITLGQDVVAEGCPAATQITSSQEGSA